MLDGERQGLVYPNHYLHSNEYVGSQRPKKDKRCSQTTSLTCILWKKLVEHCAGYNGRRLTMYDVSWPFCI